MNDAPSEVTQRLVDYAEAARHRPLPDDVREATRLHLLDTLAAIVSGSRLAAGIAGRRYASSTQGHPAGSIVGSGVSSDPVSAAIANGMAGHADESDDSHETSLTHPGCGVLSAALVASELTPSSGTDLERALALGYDVTGRFGEVLCDVMSPFRSSLATHAWGPLFGAGFAAGSLSRFDSVRFVTLLSYLTQEASGVTTWSLDLQHVLKSYVFGGMPAGGAMRALRFTQLGFSGSGDALNASRRNLLDALGIDATRAAHLVKGLGERWIMRETDIKSHPIGYPLIAPVSVVERMIREHGVRTDEVRNVRVFYHPDWYTVTAQSPMPDVNLPHCIATTLIDHRLTFAASHDEARMKDPDVLALRERISLLGPVQHLGRFDARIEIDLVDRSISGEQIGDVLGRASNPMSRDQVETKARELLEPVLGADRTAALIGATRDLDRIIDVRELIATTRPIG